MAAPDQLTLSRHRDLKGRRRDVWVRRGILAALSVIPILALLNVFGQRPGTTTEHTAAATLSLFAPSRVRGGDLFEARFHITAHRDIKNALLVLDPGWAEGMSINTIEPSPSTEASTNGSLTFALGDIPAGHTYLLFLQFQVIPTNVGHRAQNVFLNDGSTRFATLHHSITVFP